MALSKYHKPPRTPAAATSQRKPNEKSSATQAAPSRPPFPTKVTTPEKMKNGPKATKSTK